MRWRDVMEIPQAPSRGRIPKDYDYRAAAHAWNVNGTDYLLIDFFRRKEQGAFLRAAYTADDYGLCWLNEDVRTSQKLTDCYGHIKATEGPVMGRQLGDKVYMPKAIQETVYEFCLGKTSKEIPWVPSWIRTVARHEDDVNNERKRRKEERARHRMEERHRDTPEIPEAFTGYAAGLLSGVGYLFYRKSHGKGTVQCSRCGQEYSVRYRRPEGIEAWAMHISEEPVNNKPGTCEICGGSGIYKPVGRMKNRYCLQAPCYLIQPFRERGIVLREFISEKVITLEAPEEIKLGERSRTYFSEGKEQIDWHVIGVCGEFWQYWNGGGMNAWKLQDGPVWPGSWPLIKSTEFGHCGLKEYMLHLNDSYENESPARYLAEYQKNHNLEMAVKAGLWKIVKRIVRYHYESRDIMPYPKAARPADRLGIWPERLGMLREKEGDLTLLRLLQGERDSGKRLREDQIEQLMQISTGAGLIEHIVHFMGVQRFMNRVAGYAGVEFGTVSGGAQAALSAMARTYLDYLDMQEAAGADMSDQIIQHPRDLRAEHDRLVREQNEEKNRMYCADKEKAFPKIKAEYQKLNRRYRFEKDGLLIRPAGSATEIIEEGRRLHHCVGGDSYLGGHNRGSSYILFLRAASMPEMPYITVEIEPGSYTVRQWYGERDKKPNRQAIDKWLREYVGLLLKYGDMSAYRNAVRAELATEEERLLVAAG